jgi:hypothetical protein
LLLIHANDFSLKVPGFANEQQLPAISQYHLVIKSNSGG